MNLYLATCDRMTVVGWCLVLDRHGPLTRIGTSYFNVFARQLVRTVCANVRSGAEVHQLVDEITDLMRPMVGLIVVQGYTHARVWKPV